MARLHLAAPLDTVTKLRIRCPALDREGSDFVCEAARAEADLGRLGPQQLRANLRYRPSTGAADFELEGLAVAGGELTVEGHTNAAGWRLQARGEALSLTQAAALLPDAVTLGWSVAGETSVRLRLRGHGNTVRSGDGSLSWKAVTFSDASGLTAGEALAGRISWRGETAASGWVVTTQAALDAGQLYVDPVFVDLAAQPATGQARWRLPEALTTVRLDGFRLTQRDVLEARGEAVFGFESPWLRRLRLNAMTAQLPGAYATYVKPFVVGTAAADLQTAGRITGHVALTENRPSRVDLQLHSVRAEDVAGRFALRDANGLIHWAIAGTEPPPASHLRWAGGSLLGLTVGTGNLQAQLQGGDVVLTAPARIAVLDGALALRRLALRDIATKRQSAMLDARLEPITLSRLTQALGWPSFGGSLAGELPKLDYRDGALTLGGRMTASAFDGRIGIEQFTLKEPFGQVPELTATVRLRGLDLGALTEAFSFGRITGRLDGNVEGLRLIDWQPAAFRAWFQTPRDDDQPHRISQRAIENIASLGGSDPAAVLSRGFLGIFDTFDYQRLGLGCVLKEDVCLMRGLGPAKQGYYIVRGQGLPRIDVIGQVRAVSWPTLVEQIKAAINAGAAVVK